MPYRQYNFMALSEARQQSDVPQMIESDIDTMWFRDQYGAIYVFKPWLNLRKNFIICLLVGCLIGAITVKMIG